MKHRVGEMMNLIDELRRRKSGNIILVFIIVQAGCVLFSLLFPERFRYVDPANIQILFRAIPQLGFIALGVNLLMIAGEFDLSVGSTFTLTSFIMASTFNAGLPVFLALLLAVLVGACIGFLNGFIVNKTKIPSFIATLGTMMFWRGMIFLYSQAQTVQFRTSGVFRSFMVGSIGVMQAQFLWFIALAIVTWLILERHRLGNHFFAVGGNRQSAIAIGIDPARVKMIAFVIAGAFAAFSGAVSTTRITSVSPIQGEGLELQAIAACVIGGTSLRGGEGSVLGAFLGAALIYTIQDVLLLLRAPGFYLQMFVGLLILAAVVFNQFMKKE